MPTERSPSKATKSLSAPLEHCESEPNLCNINPDATTRARVATRKITKRQRRESSESQTDTTSDEIETMKQLFSAQDAKLNTIMSFMRDIKSQMSEVQSSIEFMSQKYDELLIRFNDMEEEQKSDKKKIALLESKIEFLDRASRSGSIELINVPQKNGETKSDLLHVLKKTGDVLKVSIENSEVKNIHRISTSNPSNKPIIAEFATVLKKEEVLSAVKIFNKNHKDDKLNTMHLHIEGPKKAIYVSESLTFKNKKIYAMARETSKALNYKYCWISHGTVYLRKQDGAPALRIIDESDLLKIKQ
ncbi:hypothetical protein JYU34_005222 [Plutella xylostella]|uniref:FP protein C-terminal domain-containing protein n=2 Tax=Plutella xylostella TaxID=51655 RepID=A0ABQ7QW65_PLUXY|nr:hypothetical protein JYU34_005222 [Plutella xylostella]